MASAKSAPFDIVSTYNDLLKSDPDITMPIAAIEALVLLLTHSPSSTISETLDLLEKHTAILKNAIPNPIALSAGTDLFQRYLITTLQRPGQLGPAGDFNAIRAHLLSNGRLFIKRAKESRNNVAAFGKSFVRDGSTILTNGGSRVVSALLQKAADERNGASAVRFRVIYVLGSVNGTAEPEGLETVRTLRARGVPVATIPESAVAYSLGKVDTVIVGAEGVVENGGVVSRMGTYQIGLLAKAMGKPFYVVAESHKFVRLYPLGQYDLPIEQHVINFKTEEDIAAEDASQPVVAPQDTSAKTEASSEEKAKHMTALLNGAPAQQPNVSSMRRDTVDFTPPHLITALITEGGVLTPSAVSEELIKIWF
ncbi:hypothetical protein UA08_06483 [Talaromyces atroroseus]|uniref:Translation initiation factor eIF2B subunit alpha n=1 Tax=Talaromyces atroroseus TaxID=1441469 RepID=A0A225ARC7_TALAT|nr:hypothetical protein UA08_06483 [Talaromyces atroroseus]OKL58139.1 hypothetical protein UA08_06483 [Talaromyces atroroseus]